jgi:hypothetical protein
MAEVMQVLGVGDGLELTKPCYLKDYDLEANGGRGKVTLTYERSEAMRFRDGGALEAWNTPSQTVPLRLDGRPNKPLSAYTISPLKDGQEPLR